RASTDPGGVWVGNHPDLPGDGQRPSVATLPSVDADGRQLRPGDLVELVNDKLPYLIVERGSSATALGRFSRKDPLWMTDTLKIPNGTRARFIRAGDVMPPERYGSAYHGPVYREVEIIEDRHRGEIVLAGHLGVRLLPPGESGSRH